MDDELIRRMRSLEEPAEPRSEFVAALHVQLADMLGLPTAASTSAVASSRGDRRRTTVRRWLLVAAAIALLIVVVGNIGAIGAALQRLIDGPGLLESVRSGGAVRIAVRPNGPQVLAPIGTRSGFDIDVAERVAVRLGVDAELVILDTEEMLAPDRPRLEIAMPSRALSRSEAGSWIATAPVYWWPIYVLVPNEPGEQALGAAEALDGRIVCVVAGSPGEGWLASSDDRPLTVFVDAPRPQAIRALADDDACLADLAAGESDAMVSGHLSRTDFAIERSVRIVADGPVATEPRPLLVPRAASGAEAFAARLDTIVADLRADGTLAELSRQRFGGEDLTTPGTGR